MDWVRDPIAKKTVAAGGVDAKRQGSRLIPLGFGRMGLLGRLGGLADRLAWLACPKPFFSACFIIYRSCFGALLK